MVNSSVAPVVPMITTTSVKPSKVIKRLFKKKNKDGLSLKEFVKTLGIEYSQLINLWFFNKSSKVNLEAKKLRVKNKGTRISAEKNSKKKKKVQGQSK